MLMGFACFGDFVLCLAFSILHSQQISPAVVKMFQFNKNNITGLHVDFNTCIMFHVMCTFSLTP